jgi:hypothetical protein
MSRPLAATVALLVVALLGATPRWSDPAALRDAAEAALARGNYGLAEQLFERAEPRATDPGRVTLGLATAKYRLALEAPTRASSLLAEAEQLYGCCIAPDYPGRVSALIGQGNCLLRQSAGRDAGAAGVAAERFADAEHAGGATELATIARHNLQRARLLARQIPTAPEQKPDKPPPGDDPDHDRKPPESASQPQDLADAGDGKRTGARAKADAGQAATPSDESQSPGKGELPPVPDRDGQPPLTPPAAREHLERAARRIMEEARQHRRGNARTPAPSVRDW